MSIEEGTVGNNVEFLSEIMEMNETLENGSDDMLRKLKSQTEGKLNVFLDSFIINSYPSPPHECHLCWFFHNVVSQLPWNIICKHLEAYVATLPDLSLSLLNNLAEIINTKVTNYK